MAFRPSLRSTNKITEIPLDIRPVMNLMVVLIPILLFSAEFVKLSVRELNLPPASRTNDNRAPGEEMEKEKRFQLTVIIAKSGIYIGNRAGYLTGEADASGEPVIPANPDGSYDFDLLKSKLGEIKDAIRGKGFVDDKSVIISAEADIEYKHLIRLIDYVTVYNDSTGTERELFPQINIGQVI